MQRLATFDIEPGQLDVVCKFNDDKEQITASNSTDAKVTIVFRGKLPELMGGCNTFDVEINDREVELGDRISNFGQYCNSKDIIIADLALGQLMPGVEEHYQEGDVVIIETDADGSKTAAVVPTEGEGDTVKARWAGSV